MVELVAMEAQPRDRGGGLVLLLELLQRVVERLLVLHVRAVEPDHHQRPPRKRPGLLPRLTESASGSNAQANL
mgnify:CR=1 FL=1